MSTRLEQRLREELQHLAQQIAPADLRPLRRPPPRAGARVPDRLLGPIAAMTAIVILAGGLMVARNALRAHAASDSVVALAAPVDPVEMAVEGVPPAGGPGQVRLTSVATGRVVRMLPISAGGNGIALAPDATTLFVLEPNLRLTQVTIATGKQMVIGTASYPAVSPDSKYLAYAIGSAMTQVAVRNLDTGATRTISLRPWVGSDSSVLNQGGLTWLGDSSEVVAVSEPDAIATSTSAMFKTAAPHAGAPRSNACGQQDATAGLCAVVINTTARRLSAHRIFVTGVAGQPISVLSGDLLAKRSFYLGAGQVYTRQIDRVSLDARGAVAREVAALPSRSIALAMAPDGDRVVYRLATALPQSLWVATISRGKLTRRRLLVSDAGFQFNQVAW
jgi:hypothetical protein